MKIEEFVERGVAAQKAADEIIAADKKKKNPKRYCCGRYIRSKQDRIRHEQLHHVKIGVGVQPVKTMKTPFGFSVKTESVPGTLEMGSYLIIVDPRDKFRVMAGSIEDAIRVASRLVMLGNKKQRRKYFMGFEPNARPVSQRKK